MSTQFKITQEMIEESQKKSEIIGIYAYYDQKSDRYDIPFFSKDDTNAKRKFHLDVTANNGETVLGQFKNEFVLWKIGEYEINKGNYNAIEKYIVAEGKDINNA